jgi:isopentenyldiphosphate isomerase
MGVESIIEVDAQDNVIGERPRQEFFRSSHIHRASHLLLFDSHGSLLLKMRSKKSLLYPDLLDFSVTGAVRVGESYEQCMAREIGQELCLAFNPARLFHYHFLDDIDKSHREVYAAVHEGNVRVHHPDVSTVVWLSLSDVHTHMESNRKEYSPPFAACMEMYFEKFGTSPAVKNGKNGSAKQILSQNSFRSLLK